jgi:3-methyl-2-oxobutanoate hydroxymethyltransferase
MADMPFLSYSADDAEGVRNAGRFVRDGMADIVKVEADASMAGLIAKMTRAGVPVCAHVGSKPQQSALTGGYVGAGRTAKDAQRVVDDAVALERAGAAMLLVEAVPEEVTKRVLEATTVPVIGIGAGHACHGQVLVLQDLLGMTDSPPPFAVQMGDIGPRVREAGRAWVEFVAGRGKGGTGGEVVTKKEGVRG